MAIKTEQQIERDFYSLLKTSSLGTALKGKVYRDEMRPADAVTEDLVVKFIAGTDEQIQEGIVIVNIYVPDLKQKGGRSVKDFERIATLQEKALALVSTSTEYRIATEKSMTTISLDGLNQHCINLRLRFSRISD